MSITAIDDAKYHENIEFRDVGANFGGNILVYVHWEDHLSFCSALTFLSSPAMTFGALVSDVVAPAYAAHPDAALIDWRKAVWMVDGVTKIPDTAASLASNGVRHKSLIRFWTPGLTGFKASAS